MEPSPKTSISAFDLRELQSSVCYGVEPDKETLSERGCERWSICVATCFAITNLRSGMRRRSPWFSENDQWTSSSKDSAKYTG